MCRGRRGTPSILLAQVEWQAGPVLQAPNLTSKARPSVLRRDCDGQGASGLRASGAESVCVLLVSGLA